MNSLIEISPDVMLGKPVMQGPCLTVEHILKNLAAGETMEQLLMAHPRLTREAIMAIEFGARTPGNHHA